jgi:hypothetical protein
VALQEGGERDRDDDGEDASLRGQLLALGAQAVELVGRQLQGAGAVARAVVVQVVRGSRGSLEGQAVRASFGDEDGLVPLGVGDGTVGGEDGVDVVADLGGRDVAWLML